jgi:hypothetical protein
MTALKIIRRLLKRPPASLWFLTYFYFLCKGFKLTIMPQSFIITFQINDTVTFSSDLAVPEDLQNQSYRVTRVSSLILNDFYFNTEVFTCYELVGDNQQTLLVTPFRFEDDVEDKLRITKRLSKEEITALFPKGDVEKIFSKPTNINESQTILFDEATLPSSLKNWLGRSYYLDLKDPDVGSATYVDYDPKNKKNMNPELLLSKHPYHRYSLFQGDYALYFLEANFDQPDPLLTTLFLDANCLAKD